MAVLKKLSSLATAFAVALAAWPASALAQFARPTAGPAPLPAYAPLPNLEASPDLPKVPPAAFWAEKVPGGTFLAGAYVTPAAEYASRFADVRKSALLQRQGRARLGAEASVSQSNELFRRLAGRSSRAAPALLTAYEDPFSYTSSPLVGEAGGGKKPEPPAEKPRGLARLRILPDKADNRGLLAFYLVDVLLLAASSVHLVALQALEPSAERRSYLRLGHYGGQAATSLATGPLVDRSANRAAMAWTAVALGLTLGVVPSAVSSLGPTGPVFVALIGIMLGRAFFQTIGSNAGQAGYTKVLQNHPGHRTRANAIRTLLGGLVGMAASYWAGSMLGLAPSMAEAAGVFPYAAGLAVAAGAAAWLLFRHPAAGKPDAARGPKPPLKERLAEYFEGFRIIRERPFLKWSLLLAGIQMVALEPLMMLSLPQHIRSIAAVGDYGIVMAASALGTMLASLGMVLWGARKVRGDPVKRLERDGRITYVISAIGALMLWGVYAAGDVWTLAAFYGASMGLMIPLGVVWASLVQHSLGDDAKKLGRVFSAIGVIVPLATIAGTLAFGQLVPRLPGSSSLLVFAILLTVDAALKLFGAVKLFPLEKRVAWSSLPAPAYA